MYKVLEIQHLDIPSDGMNCLVKGKFYYRIIGDKNEKCNYVNCFIADTFDNDSPKLFLSDEVGETVVDKDESFGMMVGGEFAYYGMDIEVDGLIKKSLQGLVFETVKVLKLEKDGNCQEFIF